MDVYGFKPDELLEGGPMSYPDYQDLREEAKSLTGQTAVTAPQLWPSIGKAKAISIRHSS